MTRLTAQQIENLPEWMMIPDYPSYEVNCREGLIRNASTLMILKPHLCDGYPQVKLYKDGKMHTKKVHRLVANAAFGCHNISTDGLFVMHLDEERFDARISNLVLGTNKENMNFPKAKQRQSERQRGEKSYWFGKHHCEVTRKKLSEAQPKKRVGAYKDGTLMLIFNCVQLTKVYGFDTSNVCKCCKGKQRVHRGYEWRYF